MEFVNEFHRIKLNDFAKYKHGKREDFIPIEKKIENELESKLFPRLSKKEIETITNFYKEPKFTIKSMESIPFLTAF